MTATPTLFSIESIAQYLDTGTKGIDGGLGFILLSALYLILIASLWPRNQQKQRQYRGLYIASVVTALISFIAALLLTNYSDSGWTIASLIGIQTAQAISFFESHLDSQVLQWIAPGYVIGIILIALFRRRPKKGLAISLSLVTFATTLFQIYITCLYAFS